MFLDFEKAFDTVEWSFIWKMIASFNFRSSLISWIKLCYHNIESCIFNNGWASNYFSPRRGVRQGCPHLPYIFILCAEILANKIRQNKDKALGVWISSNPTVSMKANYNGKLLKVRNCLSCWEYCRLHLLGEIIVVKSLIASACLHSVTVANKSDWDKMNNMFYSFLWSGRGDKI